MWNNTTKFFTDCLLNTHCHIATPGPRCRVQYLSWKPGNTRETSSDYHPGSPDFGIFFWPKKCQRLSKVNAHKTRPVALRFQMDPTIGTPIASHRLDFLPLSHAHAQGHCKDFCLSSLVWSSIFSQKSIYCHVISRSTYMLLVYPFVVVKRSNHLQIMYRLLYHQNL